MTEREQAELADLCRDAWRIAKQKRRLALRRAATYCAWTVICYVWSDLSRIGFVGSFVTVVFAALALFALVDAWNADFEVRAYAKVAAP